MKNSTKRLLVVLFAVFCIAPLALAQAPAAAPAMATPAASAAVPPPPAPKPILDADLASTPVPSADAHAKGDPDGSLTGNASDVTVSDPKKGLTIGDLANQVGQNKIAVNFVWTLITGYLVMFMQLGFALLETGLARAKNANHTMMMNMGVYGIGMFAYWLIGFAIQMGGVGAVANLGGTAPLSAEFTATVFGKPFGLFGQHGLFLMHKGTYDVGVMVLFLFQMVFMDTGATIPTGAAVERWKFSAFAVTSFLFAAFTYPLFANWAWGGGWLANLGTNFGLGKGYCDFAGSGVVHAVGGLSALAIAMILGPRIGKFSREGRPQVILAHDIVLVITGCLILAFGWFGFNPGSTLGASSSGNLRIGSIAVNTMLASATGMISAMLYMWFMYQEAGCFHDRQRIPGRAGGDYRPFRVRESRWCGDHRAGRGRSGMSLRRLCRTSTASRRPGRGGLRARHLWHMGRHFTGSVCRRQKQLWRRMERRERFRDRAVLR